MPDDFFISIRKNRIHIHQYGNGPRVIIAFHGFGEKGTAFAPFESLLPPEMTLYAPDLPLHGATEWTDHYFYPKDIQLLVQQLLNRCNVTTFCLLGYSMGGKIALSLIPTFIKQIHRLVLAAPDGLKPNFWYSFVTRNLVGRMLFRYVTYHPAVFQFLLNRGIQFSLMNESTHKFVIRHMREKNVRKQVFDVWNCIKKIKPDIPEINRLIRHYQLPVNMYFGRYDRIFPPELGGPYKNIPTVQVKITEGGHQLINNEVAKDIIAFLSGK